MEMYHFKQRVDGFHPTLDPFDGAKPVRLLSFLTTMREAFDTLEDFETEVMRVLAYFLGCEPGIRINNSSRPSSLTTLGSLPLSAIMPAG